MSADEAENIAVEGFVGALLSDPDLGEQALQKLFRKFPRAPGRLFRKSELIQAIRRLGPHKGWPVERLTTRLRMKPVRSQSGVLPVTVLTKPFPCPGRCVFCPNDVRMPKSYLSNEPGALRAAMFRFDPFAQMTGRLTALAQNGHVIEKVELIVLGGTWTHYPESYRIGFILRCFDAMNAFDPSAEFEELDLPEVDYAQLPAQVRAFEAGHYNTVIQDFWRKNSEGPREPHGSWAELERAFELNQDARCRNVGLSVETRPDEISPAVVRDLRRVGATKVQIGLQSMNNEILDQNKRGHDVQASREAISLLRSAGFKIQAHWMANLVGAQPQTDKEDYLKLFSDPAIRPDELKLYPNSLIESAELMTYYQNGDWRPYTDEELLEVVSFGLRNTPRTCRLSRVIRDIPGTDIVVGNKSPNFRETAEKSLQEQGVILEDIRAREIRSQMPQWDELHLCETRYESGIGEDIFLEVVDTRDRIAGFCRLSFPDARVQPPFSELVDAALVRELHVYGPIASLDLSRTPDRAQHAGLGRWLLDEGEQRAVARGFAKIAVIAAVGTRRYYEKRGYIQEGAYHVKAFSEAG